MNMRRNDLLIMSVYEWNTKLFDACADSVYQAVFPSPPKLPVDEAIYRPLEVGVGMDVAKNMVTMWECNALVLSIRHIIINKYIQHARSSTAVSQLKWQHIRQLQMPFSILKVTL